MTKKHKVINIVLLLIGLGVVVFYNFCGGTCEYFKGDLLGIDLKYLGLMGSAGLLILILLKMDLLYLIALSFGIGAEIKLVSFQVIHDTFCPYCLIFAAILFFLFAFNLIFNLKRSRLIFAGMAILIGFIAFSLFFNGRVIPAYEAVGDGTLPSFGRGEVQVRLYTDYLCASCSVVEPKIEPILTELVRKDLITLIFIDTPIHLQSPFYAKYFVYIFNQNKSFEDILLARAVLFEAAQNNIIDKTKLEEHLKRNHITFKEIDPRAVFKRMNVLLTEDDIKETPQCVIIRPDGKKAAFKGEKSILGALEILRAELRINASPP